ncbi:HAUS augmin-like complex subunit 6 N-terminus-domain-containing protein [Diaporthe sp. PMI_573]|nr:HAUS augmin-like complex subunit 6 N-terminus-domain-containing protein [Diaporthaceae sp. PMI_573]
MAAVQNNLLSRTRSARVPAPKSTKNLTSTSETAASSKHHTTVASSPSNVSLFLTNLHLLDLDLLPDWPGLNLLTFTNKDAAQGQKKRVQCVEWALYQLFAIWDPEEARNKLQPFFPPLEQVQSVNLRAALLRCLEQAKKNGILGRDTVLRKTMLDECRGERLEEVLAVFSSAVLKKVAIEEQLNSKAHPCLAQTLALENRGYTGERTDLSSLIMAHKVSIKNKLDRKRASRAQYNHFAQVLDSKEKDIASRRDEANAKAYHSKIPKLSDVSKQEIRRTVRTNWSGHEQWMEALLYGDTRSQKDGVLTAPFDRVWRRVRSDRLDELGDTSGGLLEQLDNRVRAQQSRLDKWQSFRKEMFSDVVDQPKEKAAGRVGPQRGIDFGFGAHEGLHLGRMSPGKLTSTKKAQLTQAYRTLVDGLEAELNKPRGRVVPTFGLRKRREQPLKSSIRSSSSEKPAEETVSELSELEEELAKTSLPFRSKPPETSSRGRGGTGDPMDLDLDSQPPQKAPRPRLPQPLKTMQAFRPKTVPTEISPTEPSKPITRTARKQSSPRRSPVQEYKSPSHSPIRPSRLSPSPSPSRSPTRGGGSRYMTQSPEEIPPSPTQQQADQILASMNAASPSPIKQQQQRPRHTLSLAERTRLSMARGSSVDLDDDDEVALSSPSRPRRRNTSSRSPTKGSGRSKPGTPTTLVPKAQQQGQDGDGVEKKKEKEEDDIVSRTRKSMANFEATQHRVRQEKERTARREARKKSMSNKSGEIARQAYFAPHQDTLDEEADGGGEGEGNSTAMLEELIAREAEMGTAGVDYDSVFRSRPRIKASPPGTPGGKQAAWGV